MSSPARDPRLLLVGLCFFLSGAAALVYQVAWQRILALQTGVGLYSIAVIVAVFMAGLGIGSRLGGGLSARVPAPRALVLFALCEIGVAAYGALSCRLLYDGLYVRWGALFAEPVRAGLVQLTSLATPTILMGMSLPLLARAMVRDVETASGTLGFLYGINVLGAAVGALLTPWVLIRHAGIRGAVWAAVGMNVVAGVTAIGLGWGGERTGERTDERTGETTGTATATATATGSGSRRTSTSTSTSTGTGGSFQEWIALYALSGLCALALEMVWFRILEIAVKAMAYTFGTLLAVYLLGSAIGSFAGIPLARRLRDPRSAFLAVQCLLLGYACVVMAVLVWLPPTLPGFRWFYEVWGGYRVLGVEGDGPVKWLLRLYIALPILLFGPPTLLMGLSYPILQRAVQDDPATSGRKVGLLQAANIAGCVAGSLLVGLVALRWIGTTGTFRMLALVGVVLALLGLRQRARRRSFALLALLLAAVAVAVPSQRAFWMRLHGTRDEASLLEEDATGVVALIPAHERWKVWAGGRTHSQLPFGAIHTALGAAPALIHDAPREVAIVGLGSGDTAASAGCRFDVGQRVTVFELYAPEHRLLRALLSVPDPPAKLGRLLEDARYRFRIADGRNALERDSQLYDVIEADALWPTTPYSGNLYSLEFFRMCGRRLRPGGLVTTWAPTPRVRATFMAVFPHVIEIARMQILLGSLQPIAIDPERWRARAYDPATVAYLGGPRASAVWVEIREAQPAAPPPPLAPNQDLFPRDEFETPD